MGFGIRSLLLVSALIAGVAVARPLRPFAKAALTVRIRRGFLCSVVMPIENASA